MFELEIGEQVLHNWVKETVKLVYPASLSFFSDASGLGQYIVKFDIHCSKCGSDISNNANYNRHLGMTIACEKCTSMYASDCLEKQLNYDEGYEAGIDAGYNEGYNEGYDEGYNAGYNKGMNESDGTSNSIVRRYFLGN